MAVTLNKANLVLKDANGNIGKIEQLSDRDLAKIKTAVSDVALVVNQSNHTPIEATTTNKGVVQLATPADVVSGASDKVVTAEQLHNSTTGTSALATENLARIDAVVTEAGISVDHTNTNQLKTAVTTLISNATPATATANTLGVVKPDNDTITIDSNGVLTSTAQMPSVATTTNVGVVKPDGSTITVDGNGTLTATAQMPGVATNATVGVVKPDGSTITVDGDGTLTATAPMPGVATTSSVGVVQPDGRTITITADGVISSVYGPGSVISGNSFLGEIILYTGTDLPTGYLPCDGTAIKDCDIVLPEFYAWVVAKAKTKTLDEYKDIVAQNGECGYFGVDTVTKTVCLPYVNHFIQSTTNVDEVGSNDNKAVTESTSATALQLRVVKYRYFVFVNASESTKDNLLSYEEWLNWYKANDVGIAGTMGFGVGVCPYTTSQLAEKGYTPCEGYTNPLSANYGNYEHSRGGTFVWIPKFYCRYGDNRSPKYATYGANTIEIRRARDFKDTADAESQGFFLPTCFRDGGEEKEGFMCAKYVSYYPQDTNGTYYCKSDAANSPNLAVAAVPSYTMMEYAQNTSKQFMCTKSSMKVARDLICLAQAQNATSTYACGWYDPTGVASRPLRGKDINNKAKYTHNGQANGTMDEFNIWEFCPDVTTAGTTATQGATYVTENALYIMKDSVKFTDYTNGFGDVLDVWGTAESLLASHDKITVDYPLATNSIILWGNGTYPVFTDPLTTDARLFGIIPRNNDAVSSAGINLLHALVAAPCCQSLAYHVGDGDHVYQDDYSCFSRYFTVWRSYSGDAQGCRLASYVL